MSAAPQDRRARRRAPGARDRAAVLRHWRALELFGAQPAPAAGDPGTWDVPPGGALPWSASRAEPAGEGREWRHAVYLAPFALEDARALIHRAFPAGEEAREAPAASGHSALAAWTADEDGVPVPATAVLSECAWAVGRVLRGGPSAVEDEDIADARAVLWELVGEWDDAAPHAAGLQQMGAALQEALGVAGRLPVGVARVRRYRVRAGGGRTDDGVLLNGFFTADLARVARAVERGDAGHALWRYLAPPGEDVPPGRVDVGRRPGDAALRAPAGGHWPAPAAAALSADQRLAVAAALGEAGGWAGGIVAVNGPPGTGKTTILRDLVASVVVERARALADLPAAAAAFAEPVPWGPGRRVVHPLRPHLAGHEMVLACATNAAAENVTAEIPARAAVGEEWADEAAHLPGLASLVLRAWHEGAAADRRDGAGAAPGEAWGLVAACLGSRRRNADFARALWWGELPADRRSGDDGQIAFSVPGERHPGLRAVLSAQAAPGGPAPGEAWRAAVSAFRAAAASEAALRPGDPRAAPGAGHDAASTRLFLAALGLHRALLRDARGPMEANLRAVVDVLAGRTPAGAGRRALVEAWRTLFLVVPLVSTTFASLARLFAGLGREDIGWLLVDEAAQVPAAHAAGGIWRSRRVVVVGDPRQLEPIMALPAAARAGLRAHRGVDVTWSADDASVQALADRVSRLGTRDGDRGPWVGVPLTEHRRCEEPMFSIVNRMAYAGRMRNRTVPRPGPALPPSAWLDVRAPDAPPGHWRPAEGERLVRVLAHLERAGVDPGEVLVLTPFRQVAAGLRRVVAHRPGVRAGTVHTAQGREADVVILVLGSDPAAPGARAWATRRPNLLNVAVSRARRRLWVIGDRDAWARHPHARLLAEALPSR